MPTMFERWRLAGAVVVGGALLFLSNYVQRGWPGFLPEPTTAQDVADVEAGVAILSRAKSPMTGIQPCDAVKALVPDKFSSHDGDLKMTTPTDRDVILCFKGDIDYGEALKAAQDRRLVWQGGIGGQKILAFAPNLARFMQIADQNGLHLAPGELRETAPYLDKMAGHDRAHRDGSDWIIDPSPVQDQEALYGPYLNLAQGEYDLTMAFKPMDGLNCGELLDRLKVRVEVTAEARTVVLAPLNAVQLKTRAIGDGCEVAGRIGFKTPAGGARALETPIWVDAPVRVRVSGYALVTKR
jgi:hypothetical protein